MHSMRTLKAVTMAPHPAPHRPGRRLRSRTTARCSLHLGVQRADIVSLDAELQWHAGDADDEENEATAANPPSHGSSSSSGDATHVPLDVVCREAGLQMYVGNTVWEVDADATRVKPLGWIKYFFGKSIRCYCKIDGHQDCFFYAPFEPAGINAVYVTAIDWMSRGRTMGQQEHQLLATNLRNSLL